MTRRSLLMLAGLIAFGFAVGLVVYRLRQGRGGALGTLSLRQGTHVERDKREAMGQWAHADLGAQFFEGDGVRTGSDAHAEITLADRSVLVMARDTTLRFRAEPLSQNELSLDVEAGEAVIHVQADDLVLRTHVGLAVLQSNSAVHLTRDGPALVIGVELGTLHFSDAAGKPHVVAGNEEVRVGIGMALLDSPPDASAFAIEVHGAAPRLRTKGSANFVAAPASETRLAAGTELDLLDGTEVALVRGDQRALLRGAGRYRLGVGDALVSTEAGSLQVVANGTDVKILVPGGAIIARGAEGGSLAELKIQGEKGSLVVERGMVTTRLGSASHTHNAGTIEEWPVNEEPEEPTSAVEVEQTTDAAEVANLPSANLRVKAGESFVVHAPTLPVTVGFDVGTRCDGPTEIEISDLKTWVRGTEVLNVAFGAGRHAYAVRCAGAKHGAGKVIARGSSHILLDAGTRKLPAQAPTADIETDGRTYTIYYQNQLPDIRVRWPNPPATGPYTLEVDGKATPNASAMRVFDSGTLRDGVHLLAFAAGNRHSRTATVEIRFDNTGPTASLNRPSDRSFWPGDTVRVEGVALRAWKVDLLGGTIERDAHDRFEGEVGTSVSVPDIVVRLRHPRRGTHYYLRRSAVSS